jgi:hypothetical protein
MTTPWIEFTVKLILFAITYYFILDYIVICGVPTKFSASITIGVLITITVLYILFSKKTIRRCNECGSEYKIQNKILRFL